MKTRYLILKRYANPHKKPKHNRRKVIVDVDKTAELIPTFISALKKARIRNVGEFIIAGFLNKDDFDWAYFPDGISKENAEILEKYPNLSFLSDLESKIINKEFNKWKKGVV